MSNQVLTGALALIKVKGTIIGKMKSIRIEEEYELGRVSGIGQIHPDELPVLSWRGTLSCEHYTVDFLKSTLPGALNRNAQTLEEYVDNIILNDIGIDVDIYKKVEDLFDPTTGLMKAKPVTLVTVRGLFLRTHGMDLSMGEISGTSQSFEYKYPIFKPV